MEAERAMQQSLLQYLRHRVMPILEPLQFDVMTHQPADLHEFSYLWLQNYSHLLTIQKKDIVKRRTSPVRMRRSLMNNFLNA